VTLTRRRLAVLGAALGVSACSAGPTARPEPPTPAAPSGSGPAPERIAYGPDPSQYAELHRPGRAAPGGPLVVVLHGGFWRSEYGAELGAPLAADLARAGVTAWNVEYRRVGGGGGWPATFDDVAAAVDAVPRLVPGVDPARVVVLGHSAGGQLAGWLAARHRLPADAPGGPPRVRPRGVVSQAGVLDLVAADALGMGGGATAALLGGPAAQLPERYRLASPAAQLPLGVPVVCVHGDADTNVPISQSRDFVRDSRAAGDPAELVEVPGADHFALIDPTADAWRRCREACLRLLG
jgi:acetyl esterase/lipase